MSDHQEHIHPLRDEIIGQIVLNKYRILKELARGGMGVVYLARVEGAEGFVRPVVVKRILPQLASDSEFLGMFIREAQIMVNLKDQGVASVLDFAEESGSYIMVLEYVRGYQLRQWSDFVAHQERTIPTAVVVQIMINVLDALHHVHTAKDHMGSPLNIVHRDICPSNVLLDTEGLTKIVDFGIGVISSRQHSAFKTHAHRQFKGKLLYGAPELFENCPANPCSDVYAAAVMMHELLVGDNEFLAKSDAAVLNRILHHKPSHVYENRQDANLALDEIVQRGLKKNPAARFQTAAEFADALRDLHPMNEREGVALVKKAVLEDFGNEIARFVGEESLEERDRIWSNYDPSTLPVAISRAEDTRPIPHEDATVVYREVPVPAKRRRWLLPVLAIGLFLIGVTGWFFFDPGDEQEVYIVSGANPSEAGVEQNIETSQAKQAPLSDTQPVEQPAQSQKTTPVKTTPPEAIRVKKPKPRTKISIDAPPATNSSPEELGKVFSTKSPLMLQCMQRHLADIPLSAKLKVRLSIAQSGKVTKAEVQPKGLATTGVGKCIEKVAQTTIFPPQSKPLTIRIPINFSLDGSQ